MAPPAVAGARRVPGVTGWPESFIETASSAKLNLGMHCTCVRQTDLPNTSRLAADVLYDPDRAARFYRHPLHGIEGFRGAADEMSLPDERRAAVVGALRQSNPASAALDRLAQPGTMVVATGQQVGLFSGPCYTIYKALHAARLAAWLTANGIPAVPVFWLATEDHDFAEVSHVSVFDAGHRPVKLEMRRSAGSTQPVGGVPLASPPVAELRTALRGFPFADEVCGLVERTYRPGNTMGAAFGELLRGILADFDIPQLDPMLPAFRELAAPTLRAAVEAAPELTAQVLERDRELVEAGYHAQVHVEENTSFVFLLEGGKRLALRRHGNEYVLNGRRFAAAELMDRAASLSPNALLRPVVQDSMLPTVAYVGGPAETAYLAQSEAIYSVLLGRMPVPVMRTGFTIVDAHSYKLMERYGLKLADFFHGEDPLREHIAARLVPPSLSGAMRESSAAMETALERLRERLAEFDPTLGRALDNSSRKIRYQLGKLEGKTRREALRRNVRATADAASLGGLIYPEQHLQERIYSILPFLAKHGFPLIGRISEAISLECPDHRLLVV
jgi:bacillithiol synthase